MKLHFLASGSKGNCTLVESRGDLLVVDAGIPKAAFLAGLRALFPDVRDHMASALRAIVVSHEHADHAGRAGELSGAFHIPIYCSSECLERGAERLMKKAEGEPIVFTPGQSFKVGVFRVWPVPTYHVRGAVGFQIESDADNLTRIDGRVSIFTDVPEITPDIKGAMMRCGVICVEADYDETLLANSSYVDDLKQRIRLSHMENGNLARFFANGFDARGVHDVVLLHLSKESNIGFIAEGKMRAALPKGIGVTALSDSNLPMTLAV